MECGIDLLMDLAVRSATMLDSGLSLFHEAGALAASASQTLSSGNPDWILDGVLGLQTALRTSELASRVVRTAQELDETGLDMLV